MSLSPGTRLGPYEILGPIGEGGMGEVYSARDPRLEREVAVKVLPQAVASDPDRLRRFEREARAAGTLDHPNILAIHDVGAHEGRPYVVSELLRGETLRQSLRLGKLTPRKALDLGVQVARGLAAAHEKGIVHRDIKPENLFVTRDALVKILDFGLAKVSRLPAATGSSVATASASSITEPGTVMGTVGYMSPEQVRGQPIDHRSDIFSLGAVLYEALSGERAFRGGSAVEVLHAILKEDPPGLSRAQRGLPPPLQALVVRCLEKRPDDRFQSAHDLALALEAAATPTATAARLPALSWRRLRPGLALGGVALAALLAAAVWGSRTLDLRSWFRTRPTGRSIESLAVLPLDNLSGDPEQEYFADGMTEELTARLATIGALRVTSRRSVMQFKRTGTPLAAIARALKVEAVIEGSVRRAGSRVRITTQLVRVEPERQLWSEVYERDVRDVLSLQDEVARSIARAVEVRLTPREQSRLSRGRTVNPAAHEACLRGRFHLERLTREDLEKAVVYFQRAVEADPGLAAAHGGLADAYLNIAAMGYSPPSEAIAKAEAAASRATELDDLDGRAQAALGRVRLWTYDWPAAERGLRRAIDLDPSDADARRWYADYLFIAGRGADGRAERQRSLELDPLSLMTNDSTAAYLEASGRFDEAIAVSRKVLELDPRFPPAHYRLLHAYRGKAMYPESLSAARTLLTLMTGDPEIAAAIDRARARSGYEGAMLAAARRLEELSKVAYVKPYFIAECFALAGRTDESLRWLGRAYEERDPWLIWVRSMAGLRRLHPDRRFQDLVRRMRFPAAGP